jgi:hypothetical protein
VSLRRCASPPRLLALAGIGSKRCADRLRGAPPRSAPCCSAADRYRWRRCPALRGADLVSRGR